MSAKSVFMTLALIILMTITVGCQMEAQATKVGEISTGVQTETSASTEQTEEVIYQVGDIISIDQTILVVLGWDQPPGGDLNPPDQGKKYLVVDLMIGNQGERSFNVSPAFQMTLKDTTGQKYNVNGKANIASGSSPPNGEVNPGEILRGKVGFHIPESQMEYKFVYEANLIGLGEVTVDLGSTPVAMEPPTGLNLGDQQTVYRIGDVVEISGLTIQVLDVSFPEGSGIVQPKEGYKFVSVDIQIDNEGESIQEISSVAQMYLKDSSGQKYTFHLGAQAVIDKGLPDDELRPGERIRGQIGFQVPKEVQELIYVFDADLFGFGKVFISLE